MEGRKINCSIQDQAGGKGQKKAYIFDLDGTLADTIHSIARASNRTLACFGYAPLPEKHYNYYAGDGAKELVRRFLSAARLAKTGDRIKPDRTEPPYLPDEDAEFQRAFIQYKRFFAEDCMYEVKPFDGIPELLSELRSRGIRTAVLSNKPHAQTVSVVKQLFGTEAFDLVQGQVDGIPKKPAPDGALRIAEQFSVRPEDCVYCGDTNTDMQTGKAAGMFTVGVLWGFREEAELRENGADALAAHPLALLNYLTV